MRRPLPEPARVAVASLAAALVTWRAALWPLRARLDADWTYFEHMWETGRVALTRHATLPLWDPYHCGGISLWGNPQAQVYHPLFALTFALGSVLAMKVFLVAHCAAGVAGMRTLARSRGASEGASWAAAGAWACSGFFAWHGHAGHLTFAAFYLAPWALLAWRRAETDPRACVGVAAVFLATLLAGGTYPAPFLALLLLVDALTRMTSLPRAWAVARAGLASAGLSLLLGAMRLAPIAVSLRRHPREMREPDAVGLGLLRDMLLARDHAYRLPDHLYAWDEYGAFVGVAALALATVGLCLAPRGRRALPLAIALCFGLVALGDLAPWMPWPLLHRLPVFDSLRVPSRFAVWLTLGLAMLAAEGVDALASRVRTARLSRALPWILAAMISVEVTHAAARIIEPGAAQTRVAVTAPRLSLVDEPDEGGHIETFPARNVGTMQCYDPLHPDVAPGLWTGDVAQARFVRGDGAVLRVLRTAQWYVVDVAATCPARLVLNQNHDPDWSASTGRVVADEGRLAVELGPGRQRVVLRHDPVTLAPSLLLSALGALVCAWTLRRNPRWSSGSLAPTP